MPTRSWRQPWGMKSPNFMEVLSLLVATPCADTAPPANPYGRGRGKSVARRHRIVHRVSICVVGTSYVGLSLAVLLCERHDVVAYDIDERRVEMLRSAPQPDRGPRHRGAPHRPGPAAHRDDRQARGVPGAELVLVATPDRTTTRRPTTSTRAPSSRSSATSSRVNPDATVVIRSTIPVGYTAGLRRTAGHRERPLLAGVPARGTGAARQPPPLTDHRRRPGAARAALRRRCSRRRRSTTTYRCC